MHVDEIMSHESVCFCHPEDSLARAAQLFWDHDCGALPVVDAHGKVVAMITDRDALIAAHTQGKRLDEIPVRVAMSKTLHACRPEDSIGNAEKMMKRAQVRRLPVVDVVGRLVGMLSLGDIARAAEKGEQGDGLTPRRILDTMAAITAPHATATA